MGQPVEVLKLARDMIRLSGMTIRDENNPDGDIEIIFTGLRPGEKLYEELLVDEKSVQTSHEKIFKAEEAAIEWESIKHYLQLIETSINNNDAEGIRNIFDKTIDKIPVIQK